MPHILTLLVLSQRTGLNSSKSEFILFGTSTCLCNFPPLTGVNIAETVVPLSDKIVTLGVTLDSNLTFSNHISDISVDLHIITSGHCVISGGLSQMTWPRWLPLPLSTHVSAMLTLSSKYQETTTSTKHSCSNSFTPSFKTSIYLPSP